MLVILALLACTTSTPPAGDVTVATPPAPVSPDVPAKALPPEVAAEVELPAGEAKLNLDCLARAKPKPKPPPPPRPRAPTIDDMVGATPAAEPPRPDAVPAGTVSSTLEDGSRYASGSGGATAAPTTASTATGTKSAEATADTTSRPAKPTSTPTTPKASSQPATGAAPTDRSAGLVGATGSAGDDAGDGNANGYSASELAALANAHANDQKTPAPPKADGPAPRGDTKYADPAAGATATAAVTTTSAAQAPAAGKDSDKAERTEEPTKTPPATSWFDYGATVYLSNDDSMSLASAQRVLWAVQNDHRIRPSEVRPHELLNYFSFDTAPVEDGQLFSVEAAAEKTGADTLTAAFTVHGATPPPRPLDLTLVVDISGSMRQEGRMDYTKEGLSLMTGQLHRGDRLDLVAFDDKTCTALEDYVVGRDDPSLLTSAIDALAPRGGTDLSAGLREGYRLATAPERQVGAQRSHRVMMITDALVNRGDVDPATIATIGKALDDHDVRLTGVGVGRDFDDTVLDELTEKGKGAYVYLGSDAVVQRVFGSGFQSLVQTIAHDVQFSVELPKTLAMQKFYGEEASTDAEDVQPINYYAGTTQLFLQDLHVDTKTVQPSDKLVFHIKYREAATGEPAEQTWETTVGALLGGDRRDLDKGRALIAWSDMLSAKAAGRSPCGSLSSTYAERAAVLSDDAEIAYVNGLAKKWCPIDLPTSVAVAENPKTGVPYKVRVDSDVPIPEVTLACATAPELKDRLTASDTIARFDAATPGPCKLVLAGTTPLEASLTVPPTGGDVTCRVRGGRVTCS